MIECFWFCWSLHNWKPYCYVLHVYMYNHSWGKFMVSSLNFVSRDFLRFLSHLFLTQSGCRFADDTPSTVEDFSAWQSSCKAVILVCTLLALQYSSFMSKWFALLYWIRLRCPEHSFPFFRRNHCMMLWLHVQKGIFNDIPIKKIQCSKRVY